MQKEESRELQSWEVEKGDRKELRKKPQRQWSVKGDQWERPGVLKPRTASERVRCQTWDRSVGRSFRHLSQPPTGETTH